MSNNARDTQFKNFAKLLLDELCLASDVHIETPFNDDWREEWEETIAQRAYDLVEHTIRSQAQGMDLFCLHDPEWMKERVDRVPDMTKLPKEY